MNGIGGYSGTMFFLTNDRAPGACGGVAAKHGARRGKLQAGCTAVRSAIVPGRAARGGGS